MSVPEDVTVICGCLGPIPKAEICYRLTWARPRMKGIEFARRMEPLFAMIKAPWGMAWKVGQLARLDTTRGRLWWLNGPKENRVLNVPRWRAKALLEAEIREWLAEPKEPLEMLHEGDG